MGVNTSLTFLDLKGNNIAYIGVKDCETLIERNIEIKKRVYKSVIFLICVRKFGDSIINLFTKEMAETICNAFACPIPGISNKLSMLILKKSLPNLCIIWCASF